MGEMRFHHIGIACRDIEEGKKNLQKLFSALEFGQTLFDKEQDVSLCMARVADGLSLELIAGEPVRKLVEKNVSYYHLCFEVDDIESAISDMTGNGAILVSEPKPAVLFGSKRVAFLYSPAGLVELVEEKARS